MSAEEPTAEPAVTSRVPRPGEQPPSMRDLLAACAAADAVSTPPRAPAAAEPEEAAGTAERDAA
ncbi:hypothetical protein [Streptomyces sp. ISL-11]|uniref:hypothetical protein n=1 Tax=Streptomyces sp. ISL-11 TaxID=2819174 RepID=UPI001BE55C6B|nr:hypothetical protein [Streptomyces sp. ISL-11]MBT2385439.1 hypothetical protein [Streptomyces sp. ISL-11]